MVELGRTQTNVTKLLDEVKAAEKAGKSLVEFALVRAVYRKRAVEHSVNDLCRDWRRRA